MASSDLPREWAIVRIDCLRRCFRAVEDESGAERVASVVHHGDVAGAAREVNSLERQQLRRCDGVPGQSETAIPARRLIYTPVDIGSSGLRTAKHLILLFHFELPG